MVKAVRIVYTGVRNNIGEMNVRPLLPLLLKHDHLTVSGLGLLDTGSTVNVPPFALGLEPGLIWEQHTISVTLVGSLASSEARGVLLDGIVEDFEPATLAFAWTRNENAPLILGHVNFFEQFDVCFFTSQAAFEISPRAV